jgi:hypothetical protein
MKKILLLMALVSFTFTNAQVTIFEDGFETYTDFEVTTIGDWTQIDVDGDATYGSTSYDFTNESYTGTAIVFNPSATTNADGSGAADPATGTVWDAHTGDKGLYFVASTGNVSGTALNNDYMITPQIDLTGATGSSLNFWAKSLTDQWGNEKFEILLSTSGNSVADFTENISGLVDDTPTDYTEYTYDLSAYDGQQVYIAIHYVSADTFVFQLDDFKVSANTAASVNENILSSVSIYPNVTSDSFTVKNTSNIALTSVTLFDINGRVVLKSNLNNSVVNVSNLSAGMYFVEINSANAKITRKLIKK